MGNARRSRAESELSQAQSESRPSRAASEMRSKMEQLEPDITNRMRALEAATGGKLVGLDFRLKTLASLDRKIKADAKEAGISEEEAAANIADAVRYTLQFEPTNYTAGVQGALDKLKEQGWEVKGVKNFWKKGDPYQGINVKLKRDGILTELQFHTPQSLDTKEKVIHKDYEIFRDKKNSQEERKAAYMRMVDATNKFVPDPAELASLLTIGTLAFQPFA